MSVAPRLAMVVNSLQRGGAEQQFLRVARAARRHGYQVRIYTLLPAIDFDDRALAGIPVVLLAPRPGPGTLIAAVRELRAWRPDVVLNFLYQATVIGRCAALLARTGPVVSSMRNERLETPARRRIYRLTGRIDAVTVTNSRRAAQVLQHEGTVRHDRLRVIPNGIDLTELDRPWHTDLRAELGLAPDSFLFLGVGRLAPQKAWPVLLDAVSRYAGPQAHVAIAGDGDRAGLQARIEADGLADRVSLLGLRDDVPGLLRDADALVLCSRYEGLPNVVLEAMALGRPVVATRVGGCPELVTPQTGLLVDPGDPAGLAEAMTRLARMSAAQRARLGARAREHARAGYSLQVAQDAWCALLDEVRATRPGRDR
ncbi:MAG: glycosyltransferase [Nocardioides sp.]|uniref:glycosyltransferase n=1 Tax=Nocardioides sp. TaxID=35761 RepID=UPI0039E548BF